MSVVKTNCVPCVVILVALSLGGCRSCDVKDAAPGSVALREDMVTHEDVICVQCSSIVSYHCVMCARAAAACRVCGAPLEHDVRQSGPR